VRWGWPIASKSQSTSAGRTTEWSYDAIRLVRFPVLLGSDVEIVVKPRARATRHARVLVA
jgi:hypothetical protein